MPSSGGGWPTEAPALIADSSSVVLLSAPATWRYASLQPLSGEQVDELVRAQFDGRKLGVMSLDIDARARLTGSVVHLSGRAAEAFSAAGAIMTISRSVAICRAAWHLIVFSSLQPVAREAMQHRCWWFAALASLVLWLLYQRQRRRVIQARLGLRAVLEVRESRSRTEGGGTHRGSDAHRRDAGGRGA